MSERITVTSTALVAWRGELGMLAHTGGLSLVEHVPTGEDTLYEPGTAFYVKMPTFEEDKGYPFVNAPIVCSPYINRFSGPEEILVYDPSGSPIRFTELGNLMAEGPKEIFQKSLSAPAGGRIAVGILPVYPNRETLFSIGNYSIRGAYMICAFERGAKFNGLYIAGTDINARGDGGRGKGNYFQAKAVAHMTPEEIRQRNIEPWSGDMTFYCVPIKLPLPPLPQPCPRDPFEGDLGEVKRGGDLFNQVDVTASRVHASDYTESTGWIYDSSRPKTTLFMRLVGFKTNASSEETAKFLEAIGTIPQLNSGTFPSPKLD